MTLWPDGSGALRAASYVENDTRSTGVIYATDYGVRADGTTPSAVKLQNAIDACKSLYRGAVVLPGGQGGGGPYNNRIQMETFVTMPDGVRLVGTSRRGTVLNAIPGTFPTNTPMIKMGSVSVLAFDCRLENLSVDMQSIANSTCVLATNLQEGGGVNNVGLYGALLYGISVTGSQNFQLRDLECYEGTPQACIQLANCISASVEYATVNAGDTVTGCGIRLYGGVGITLRHIHAERSKFGIWSDSGGTIIGAVGSSDVSSMIYFDTTSNNGVVINAEPNGSPLTINDVNAGLTTSSFVSIYAQNDIQIGTGFGNTPVAAGPVGFGLGRLKLFRSTTANRVSAATAGAGAQAYDETLHCPIWSDGTNWRNGIGTVV